MHQEIIPTLLISLTCITGMDSIAQQNLKEMKPDQYSTIQWRAGDGLGQEGGNVKSKFTNKPAGQGTGLGLSLSYDIIKAHGGEIKVETREGEGAEFIIQLPNR